MVVHSCVVSHSPLVLDEFKRKYSNEDTAAVAPHRDPIGTP